MNSAEMRPTYYVRHPDGSFSVAAPQPTDEDLRDQRSFTYPQCDRVHGGDVCADPHCYLNRAMPFNEEQKQ